MPSCARERHRLPRHPGDAAPGDERERRLRVALDQEQVAPPLERLELAQPLVVHARVHLAARGGRAALVVLDPGGQVVPARHARGG